MQSKALFAPGVGLATLAVLFYPQFILQLFLWGMLVMLIADWTSQSV